MPLCAPDRDSHILTVLSPLDDANNAPLRNYFLKIRLDLSTIANFCLKIKYVALNANEVISPRCATKFRFNIVGGIRLVSTEKRIQFFKMETLQNENKPLRSIHII